MSLPNNILKQSASIIYGCEGLKLSPSERDFFTDVKPVGFILFARNIDTPKQVKVLIEDLRATVGWKCPVLIDQEGGRVERLKAPYWLSHAPMADFGALYKNDPDAAIRALSLNIKSISHMLWELGVTVNCTPVLDIPVEGAHDIIGDRAFSFDKDIVAALGQVVADSCIDSAVTPVIKHIPGHGRAFSDSHEDLPIVETSCAELDDTDFTSFSAVNAPNYWGMTAHVLYKDIDKDLPATLSPLIIKEIIREQMGFDGFLLGDDVFMKALDPYGDLTARVKDSLDAGLDTALFCHGDVKEMELGAKGASPLREDSIKRLICAEETRLAKESAFAETDIAEIRKELHSIIPNKMVA